MTSSAMKRATRKALVLGTTAGVIGAGAFAVQNAADWRAHVLQRLRRQVRSRGQILPRLRLPVAVGASRLGRGSAGFSLARPRGFQEPPSLTRSPARR